MNFINPISLHDESEVTSCCCQKHGKSQIKAYLNKESYVAGE